MYVDRGRHIESIPCNIVNLTLVQALKLCWYTPFFSIIVTNNAKISSINNINSTALLLSFYRIIASFRALLTSAFLATLKGDWP